jgi:hypothetical protein
LKNIPQNVYDLDFDFFFDDEALVSKTVLSPNLMAPSGLRRGEVSHFVAGKGLHERNDLYGKTEKTNAEKARLKTLGTKKQIVARYAPGDVDKHSPWMVSFALWPTSWKVCMCHACAACIVLLYI